MGDRVLPYKKDRGGQESEILKRTPKKYQDFVFLCGLKCFFTPTVRGTYAKTTHHFLSYIYIFWLNTLKSSSKAPAVNFLRLNDPRGTKTAFYPLKDTTRTTSFLYGSAPLGSCSWLEYKVAKLAFKYNLALILVFSFTL